MEESATHKSPDGLRAFYPGSWTTMHRHNSSVLRAFVPACVLAVTLSHSTATSAQSWVWAEYDLWRWTTGEVEWMPDDPMLTEAEQRLEAALMAPVSELSLLEVVTHACSMPLTTRT